MKPKLIKNFSFDEIVKRAKAKAKKSKPPTEKEFKESIELARKAGVSMVVSIPIEDDDENTNNS